MWKRVKIFLIFLSVILLIGSVSAYNSFILLKENPKSYEAVVISDIDYSKIRNNPGTIIQLTENDLEYTDLIAYIRTSKITKMFYYSNEDISSETLRLIKEEGGVDVRMRIVRDSELNNNEEDEIVNQEINLEEINTDISKEPYPIIAGNVIYQQESDKNKLFLIVSIIFLLIAFIIFCLILKKRRK